jgi:hypothetical protein
MLTARNCRDRTSTSNTRCSSSAIHNFFLRIPLPFCSNQQCFWSFDLIISDTTNDFQKIHKVRNQSYSSQTIANDCKLPIPLFWTTQNMQRNHVADDREILQGKDVLAVTCSFGEIDCAALRVFVASGCLLLPGVCCFRVFVA